jgi:hypothetical protein
MKPLLRVAVLAAMVPLVLTMLAACSPTVALTPAAKANDVKCADVIVRLPGAVGTWSIRQTDAQATGAWGDPVVAVLKCGVTPPQPTENLCYTVSGIDWVQDKSHAPTYVFTTFGRTPAVQVTVNSKATNGQGTIILDDLSNAVGQIAQSTKHTCTTVIKDKPSPTPAP